MKLSEDENILVFNGVTYVAKEVASQYNCTGCAFNEEYTPLCTIYPKRGLCTKKERPLQKNVIIWEKQK